MKQRTLSVLFFAIFVGCSASDQSYTLLVASKGRALVNQCSRATPTIKDVWQPSTSQVLAAESKLEQIVDLRDVAGVGKHIAVPSEFLRQYAGWVLEDGSYQLYLNAIHPQLAALLPDGWRRNPAVVCDAHDFAWGVLYDIDRQRFHSLAVN